MGHKVIYLSGLTEPGFNRDYPLRLNSPKQLRERLAFVEEVVGVAELVLGSKVIDAHGVIDRLRDVLGI